MTSECTQINLYFIFSFLIQALFSEASLFFTKAPFVLDAGITSQASPLMWSDLLHTLLCTDCIWRMMRNFQGTSATGQAMRRNLSPVLLGLYCVILHFLHHSSILTRLCFFSPAEAPEASWMNENIAFYLLKMSHPVTVHAAPPELAARVKISRKFESNCHLLWCVTQKKLRERLVLGKSFIQVIKTDIPHLGVTSTLACLTVWALLKQLFLFLIY